MTRRTKATMQRVYTIRHSLSVNARTGSWFCCCQGLVGVMTVSTVIDAHPFVYSWSFLARVNSIKRCVVEFGNGLGQGVAIARFILGQLFE